MTPEQYKAMQMERLGKMDAAPLANQVFKPVKVTQVPTPPNYRAQEPQITPQQRTPGIGQQFGQAMTKKAVTAGVDKVTGLPIISTIFAKRGKEVVNPFPEYEGLEDTPDDYNHLDEFYDPNNRFFPPMQQIKRVGPLVDGRRQYRRLSGQERQDLMNTQPDDLSTPETFVYPTSEEGWDQWAKYRPDPRPMPPIIQDPWGPRRPGPSRPGPTFPPIGPLASADFPVAYKNFDINALPPRLRTEYLMNLERGMPHMDIINLFHWRALHGNSTDASGTISRYNEGGDVTYAETGRLAEEGKTPSVTTIWDQFNSKGMAPSQFHVPAGNPQVSPSKESYWQKAERTGLFGVPGTKNVYVDPGKGTVAYQREDVKPFTWMWNKGRNFLGYGAPLAERSE